MQGIAIHAIDLMRFTFAADVSAAACVCVCKVEIDSGRFRRTGGAIGGGLLNMRNAWRANVKRMHRSQYQRDVNVERSVGKNRGKVFKFNVYILAVEMKLFR